MKSEKLITYFINTEWEDLPEEIQHQSKRCLLDTLGALVAGMQTPVYGIMEQYIAMQFSGTAVPLMRSEATSTTTGATLVYGIAANALDIDDGCRLAKGHPGASVLPATIAAAQSLEKCSGKEFLTALVMGYEAAIRAAYIRHSTSDVYHCSGSWGAVGAAASASKLFRLNAEEYFNALGTASYHAPIAPMMVGIETPSMGKDSIAWGSFVGTSSAELAKLDYTAPKPVFDQTPNDGWIDSIGSTFEIMHLFFKPYSACRWAQAGVDGVQNIMHEQNLAHTDVKKIRIYTFEEAAALSREYPNNTEDAQYNFSYPIAAAVFHGKIGPEQILPPTIFDAQIHTLMDKIEVVVTEEHNNMFPAKTVANVEIEDMQGNRYQSGDLSPRWDLSNVLPTDEELEEKFVWLMEPMIGPEATQELVRLIWNFDACKDVNELIRLCSVIPN